MMTLARTRNSLVLWLEENPDLASWLLLAFFILLAITFSKLFFMGQSLRLDEAQSLWQTSRSPGGILDIVAQDVHVPLYHELLHFWRLYIGDSVAAGRAMSLLFYILSIPAIYFLGKSAYRRSTGLWAAALFTLSPFMNWYGNEMRMYSLLGLLVIVNQYFFIRLFKRENATAWFWYAITAVLGTLTHYFFLLTLLAQAIFYFLNPSLFKKGTFRRLFLIAVFVTVTLGVWVAYVLSVGKVGSEDPVLPVPSTVDFFNVFSQFFAGFQSDQVNTVFLSLWPLTLLFGFLGLQRDTATKNETRFLMLSLFVPIIAAYLISLFIVPLFLSRYLILTLPALYLCILGLFDSYSARLSLIVKIGLAVFMVCMLASEIVSPVTPVKEDYREATSYLNAHVTPQDAVLLSAPFTLYPVEYYYTAPVPLETLPIWNQFGVGGIPAFSEATLPFQVESLTANARDAWVLLSYDQGYESIIRNYLDAHYPRIYEHEYSPDLTLYEYQIHVSGAPNQAPGACIVTSSIN